MDPALLHARIKWTARAIIVPMLVIGLVQEGWCVGPQTKAILVVDDERDIRESLHALLSSEYPDAKVFAVASGKDAIKILEDNEIHLVITDYRMPGMDGLELLEHVKTRAPKARRGLITAYEPDHDRLASLKGVDFLLRKPIHVETFVEATDRSLAT